MTSLIVLLVFGLVFLPKMLNLHGPEAEINLDRESKLSLH
jgi:hypothetical protein